MKVYAYFKKNLTLLLLLLLFPLTAWSQITGGSSLRYYFIHVPNSSTNYSPNDIKQGVEAIASEIINDWKQANPDKTPKVCYIGFTGPWEVGGPNRPNNAGRAATALGGTTMEISYRDVINSLNELRNKCDIIIAMGEGRNGFDLETHGQPGEPPIKDCKGELPFNVFPEFKCELYLPFYKIEIENKGLSCPDAPVVPPLCDPNGKCRGTDWDQPCSGDPNTTLGEKVKEKLKNGAGPKKIPVNVGTSDPGAGNFCCGFAVHWLDWCDWYMRNTTIDINEDRVH